MTGASKKLAFKCIDLGHLYELRERGDTALRLVHNIYLWFSYRSGRRIKEVHSP